MAERRYPGNIEIVNLQQFLPLAEIAVKICTITEKIQKNPTKTPILENNSAYHSKKLGNIKKNGCCIAEIRLFTGKNGFQDPVKKLEKWKNFLTNQL